MSIIINHNAGFFSCCSIRLLKIIEYFNINKKLPSIVDSSAQFNWYKNNNNNNNNNSNDDITFHYFNNYNNIDIDIVYNNTINYISDRQFSDYSKLDYNLIPFIKKYFSPSSEIITIIQNIETKYNINYNDICVLFYRGNDKNRETKICNYNEYIDKANMILDKNPNVKFLIQSDETEFIETILKTFPSSFYFIDEIRHVKKCDSTVDILLKNTNYIYSKYYLAITIIMSKCRYIICGSGNCSMWIIFYRENSENVYQNLNNIWLN